jgi:hypothetical protein
MQVVLRISWLLPISDQSEMELVMNERMPGEPPEKGGWGAANIMLLINTVFVGVGSLFAATQSVPITLVTTIGVIGLAALTVTLNRTTSRWRNPRAGRGRKRH